MGHAGSSGSITLNVYSKTWWDERVEAVNRIVESVFAEPDEEEKKRIANPLKGLPDSGTATVGTLLGTPGCLTYHNRM